jgi:predicted Zn-dependent protease with MMP-like domain
MTPMTQEECEKIAGSEIARVFAALPAELASVRDEVLFVHEWEALDEDEIELLGVFEGGDRLDVQSGNIVAPPVIRLFLDNIREEAEDDADEFRRQVRITLLHELGHYLGLDEDGLAERGLA